MPSVTRKRQTVRARNRVAVQRRLISAVEALLAGGESFTELSVERIIREADVSRSTFYLHYPDKGALLAALGDEVAQEASLPVSKWLELPPEAARDQLREALGDLMDAYWPHATLLAAVVEAASYDETVRAHWEGVLGSAIEQLRVGLKQGQKERRIREDVDPLRTAQWLLWTISHGFYQVFRTSADRRTRNEHLQELTALIWWRLYRHAA